MKHRSGLDRRLNGEILRLAIPSILANITVPLVGIADTAIAGHIATSAGAGAAALISAIAIGSTLFDLLYWNFAFLRVGTGGLTAQAFGSGDKVECGRVFVRAMTIALGCSLLLLLLHPLFLRLALLCIGSTPEIKELASKYFLIRIWAAPATLGLMAFKGWFIGMQDSVSPMATDIVVNVTNIAASILLASGITLSDGRCLLPSMGFSGIATGTVIAQYTGLLLAGCIFLLRYFRPLFLQVLRNVQGRIVPKLRAVFLGSQTSRFFRTGADLMVRSLCFIAVYIGYTVISSYYGDSLTAVCSIMMKLLMIFSYFTDGFAYAGEAMTGRYIGEGNALAMRSTVKWTFVWSFSLAALFMILYAFGGELLLRMMTSDELIIADAKAYLPWLLLMPPVGCAAFNWDGIYIGATASRQMRNSMLWATVLFFGTFALGRIALPLSLRTPELLTHILMAAYFAHLLARTVYLTIKYKTIAKL